MNTPELSIENGWLSHAKRHPSPNYNQRPHDEISLLVIHNISLPPGEFGGPWIDALFSNQLDPGAHPSFKDIADLKVSSHLLIRRSGDITQYVPFHRRAWHAGQSTFQTRRNCNDFAIGIELEGTDTAPYESTQYDALSTVTRTLMATYPNITSARITGHEHIAPGRKTDPGPAFHWDHYFSQLTS